MRVLLPLIFALPLLACAPVAQERVSERVSEVEIKLTRLEQKQNDLEKDIEKTNQRIDRLTELISELRLELEKLKLGMGRATPSAETPVKGSKKEARIYTPERIPVPGAELKPEEKPIEEPKPEEDAETAYKKAIELYSLKKLYEARDAFLDFIKRFPENKYTDNAFFWIGRIYQELGDSQRAESVYKSLVDKCESGRLPDCNKLPDAYLQLMKIYMDRGNLEEANKYYSILLEKFPTSDAAVRAREQKLLMGE